MRIPFTKVQALRNDFVVVDGRSVPVADPAALSRFLCDRKEGVGADTLLLLHRSEEADILVRIFNPDGSEGEMSGNGTRCTAAWFLDREGEGRDSVSVETVAGVSNHQVDRKDGKRTFLVSHILAPRFRPSEIPVDVDGDEAIDIELKLSDGIFPVSCVSIGNPQAAVFDGWTEENWRRLGCEIEHHTIFPRRTNVEFVRVVAPDRMDVILWERGVGPVEASGTGASGAFTTARRKGLVEPKVRISMEGGVLELEELEDGLLMKGWCEECFEGVIEWIASGS